MASSMENDQTACLGSEIQANSLPRSLAFEEQGKQQTQHQSCSNHVFVTYGDNERKQLHEETESGEEFQEQCEYEEWLQSNEYPQKLFKPEVSAKLVPAFECVPTNTESVELCWYCIKSLPSEELNISQLMLENEDLTKLYNSERLNYQQDPRPHFGVARSSHSIPFPLWDREGPKELKWDADKEDTECVTSCPHCHLALPRDTLRWHEEKCLLFEGIRTDA